MTKRILSLLVIFAILVMVAAVPTFATEKEYKFEHLLPEPEYYNFYDELYYHYVEDGNFDSDIDWAIVYYESIGNMPMGVVRIVSDRVVYSGSRDMYYTVGWAIYDAELNEIISIDEIDVTKYADFDEGLQEAKVGYQFGDADHDQTLTIADATFIQRAIASIDEFHIYDDLSEYDTWGVEYDRPLNYISDLDGDGERTIMDATAIQMKLAKK